MLLHCNSNKKKKKQLIGFIIFVVKKVHNICSYTVSGDRVRHFKYDLRLFLVHSTLVPSPFFLIVSSPPFLSPPLTIHRCCLHCYSCKPSWTLAYTWCQVFSLLQHHIPRVQTTVIGSTIWPAYYSMFGSTINIKHIMSHYQHYHSAGKLAIVLHIGSMKQGLLYVRNICAIDCQSKCFAAVAITCT